MLPCVVLVAQSPRFGVRPVQALAWSRAWGRWRRAGATLVIAAFRTEGECARHAPMPCFSVPREVPCAVYYNLRYGKKTKTK